MNTITLNPEQLAVIDSDAPNKIVMAASGSGKTRTLVAAVLRELERTPPDRILVMTFTNTGANEMAHRLKAALGYAPKLGWLGTIHSWAFAQIKANYGGLGLPQNLSVIADDAKDVLLENVMEEMGIKIPMKTVLTALFPDVMLFRKPSNPSKAELVAMGYYAAMKRAGMLDFDMILAYGVHLTSMMFNGVLPCEWDALLVDEAQDGGEDDWLIYEQIPVKRRFACGDTRQSCYAFRGARPDLMYLRVKGCVPNWTPFEITTNYRSSARIVDAANKLIGHNSEKLPPMLSTREGGIVDVAVFSDPVGELMYLSMSIATIQGEGTPLEEIAILCRTNRIARTVSDSLRCHGIPVASRTEQPTPPDWRKAKLLLSVLANPSNDAAVYAYLVEDRGRPEASRLRRQAQIAMASLDSVTLGISKLDNIGDVSVFAASQLSQESIERISKAQEAIADGESSAFDYNAALLYLQSQEQPQATGDGVTVSTCHGSKGREFSVVFIVGLEEGNFPSSKELKADPSCASERRLCYVAATRAKDALYLSWVRQRPQYRGENVPPGPMEATTPSRFIAEML